MKGIHPGSLAIPNKKISCDASGAVITAYQRQAADVVFSDMIYAPHSAPVIWYTFVMTYGIKLH